MTAPPAQMPIFTAAASYLSPASTASDAAFPWASISMASYQYNAPRPRKSPSPPVKKSQGKDLVFVTGNKPDDFKDRGVMTRVRKQAMDSYLKKERKPKRARKQSEDNDSTGSRASIGSEQQDAIDIVTSQGEALNKPHGEGRRPSSPTHSTASGGHDQQVATPDSQIMHIPRALNVLLSSAPMVQPMRPGVLPFMRIIPRPFQSIGKPLDPFRTMFQAQHPQISVEQLKFHCSRVFGTRAMGQHWIPTLVQSPHAFLSTLCIASTHYDAIQNHPIECLETVALRQEVIYLIQQNLLNPQVAVDDFNIIAVTQLIASELITGDECTIKYHETGVAEMVRLRGGLKQLGVHGRLASTLSWVSLASAILRESVPRAMYVDFCAANSTPTYPNTATIPESPLFCPRDDFQTIQRSPRCTPRTLELLKDMRMMTGMFLHETENSRQNSLSLKNIYKRIISHRSDAWVLQRSNVLTAKDWTHEAVRIACVLQATAIIKRVPLSEALKYAAQTENSNTRGVYSVSNPSDSNESLVSPTATATAHAVFRHDSPVTSFSTSPSYSTTTVSTSPPFQHHQQSQNPSTYPPSAPTSTSPTSFPDPTTTHPYNQSYFPPPAPAQPTTTHALLASLKTAVDNSDLSDCWSDMAGVLLWIGLVSSAASRKSDRVTRKWFAALAMRCSIVLCFEHPEGIHATMLRMGEVVRGVGSEEKGAELGRREIAGTTRTGEQGGGGRKRRRVSGVVR